MKKILFKLSLLSAAISLVVVGCSNSNNKNAESKTIMNKSVDANVIYLNTEGFKNKVFDYSKSKEWAFKGTRPCVIDFYAEWCGPCKRIAPVLEELAGQYKGNVDIYKVNVDKEKELSSIFGISSIPAVLFVPMKGKPQMVTGAYSKEDYTKMINDIISTK